MPQWSDPYDRMSDKELEEHLLALAAGQPPVRGAAAGSVVISLRMPQELLDRLRAAADLRGEGYQTLMKRWLEERLAEDGGLEPPPDWDALPDDVVSNVTLTPAQLRTLATRGELLLRVRSGSRRAARTAKPPAQRARSKTATPSRRGRA